jgi:hypothetical protein
MQLILRAFPRGLLSLPPRRAFWRTSKLEAAPGGLGVAQLVVSRALCRFGRFDLSRLPEGKRASALGLQIATWTPFAQTDCAIVWSDAGWASVWAWDSAALQALLQSAGQAAKNLHPIPETLLLGQGADGVRLVKSLDGFEGQHWVGGDLSASRWWPARPDPAAWLSFQRDCGLSPDQVRDQFTVADIAFTPRPWATVSRTGDAAGTVGAAELAAYGLLILALAVPGLSLAVEHFRLAQARGVLQERLAQEGARAKAVLNAREAALNASDELRAIEALQSYPGPLVHLTAVARALPESGGVFVREWELNDGKLRLLLSTPSGEIAGGENVRAFEETGLFTDVKILTQADPRQMAFTMKLKPQEALELNPPGPSSASSEALAP